MARITLTIGLAATAWLALPGAAQAAHHRHVAPAEAAAEEAPATTRIATVGAIPPADRDNGLELLGGILAMVGGLGVIGYGLYARRR